MRVAIRPTACNLSREVTRSGHIDMRAQDEMPSALRSDTPPSAVASGFNAAGQVERPCACFAGERLSPSGRERVLSPSLSKKLRSLCPLPTDGD